MCKHADGQPPWLSDKAYTLLMWVVGTVMPALVTFIGVVGPKLGWNQVDQWQTVLSAVTAFLGTCFNIQSPRDGWSGRT